MVKGTKVLMKSGKNKTDKRVTKRGATYGYLLWSS